MGLRSYKETYRIFRNINNPVMYKGLPIKLAKISLAVIAVVIIVSMQLNNIKGISPWFVFGFAVLSITGSIFGIRTFFKKYGLNGWELAQRDKAGIKEIRADKTIEQILRDKTTN